MAMEKQRLSPAERANLVAYIDGELNDAESRAIATKLTMSVSARRELEALEKTWELLEYLPRPQASPELMARTLTQVELLAGRGDRLLTLADFAARRALRLLVLAVSALVTLALAYVVTRWVWPDPTNRLIQNLSLAQHLDEYLDVGSFRFLEQLDDSPEFKEEVSLLRTTEMRGGTAANEKRVRAMPVEERARLVQNLDRLALLDPAQQAAVREIDTRLAAQSADDRSRYLSLLRVYHLWRGGLPEASRKELAEANEEARLAIVSRIRRADREAQSGIAQLPFLRNEFAILSPLSLFVTARRLQVWFRIDAEQRAKLDRLKKEDFDKQLARLAQEHGIAIGDELTKAEQAKVRPFKKALAAAKKFEIAKAPAKAKAFERFAESRYFMTKPPEPVSSAKLYQFVMELPTWARASLDPLPPDAARKRLTVLYRLVFEDGEMPDPPKPAKGQAGRGAEGQPASPAPPRPPASTVPF